MKHFTIKKGVYLKNVPLYGIYYQMKDRCNRPKNHAYKYYGAKGISVCPEWNGRNDFINFYKWALSNGYKKGLTLDRIKNDEGYSPSNCRWTTMKVQISNKSGLNHVKIGDRTMNISQWCDELNKSRYFIYKLIKSGIAESVSTYKRS
jgi:hypothetical protein